MSTWPEFMPEEPVYNNINLSGPVGAIRTAMDAGPVKQRPRTTSRSRACSLVFAPITQDVFAQFEAWFESDLGMGALEFNMLHPITDIMKSWRFNLSQTPYSVSPIGVDAYSLSMSLEIMP